MVAAGKRKTSQSEIEHIRFTTWLIQKSNFSLASTHHIRYNDVSNESYCSLQTFQNFTRVSFSEAEKRKWISFSFKAIGLVPSIRL